jgi:cystathionine beta-lyase
MTDPKHHAATRLTHAGRSGDTGPVNPPVVRASTILFPDTHALHAGHGQRTSYGRHATDTTLALEDALCAAEGAAGCLLAPSGLAAISSTLLALLSPGDHLLMTDSAYEPTRCLCDGLLKRMGIATTYYDPQIGAGIAALLQPNTKVVFVESPGSLTFEMQDVPAIAQAAHAHGAVVVADSTWATPLGWPSFALGIDVSIHAATKYIVGHSDVMMGAVLCTEALLPVLRRTHRELGLSVSGDDAYLALRGLRTLASRLATHRTNARAVALWLREQPEVAEVLYPPLEGAPGHELWARDFHPDYACGLMGVLFQPGITPEQANRLVDATHLFGIGYSWGGYESLIIPASPSRVRTVTLERWRDRAMVRLHIGLEDVRDLIGDLEVGIGTLRS